MSDFVRLYTKVAALVAALLAITFLSGKLFPMATFDWGQMVSGKSVTDNTLPTETFIKNQLMNDNGTLKTTLSTAANPNDDFAWGDESLSESLGLWLLYAYEKSDQVLFAKSVQLLKRYFWRNGWIPWKLKPDGTEATTNALIDDLRIAGALYKAADRWGNDNYRHLADEIGTSLSSHQVVDGILSDFYDIQFGWVYDQLTLSYIDASTLQIMAQQGLVPTQVYDATKAVLEHSPVRYGFFPFSYHIKDRVYTYHDDVNLIDQIYVAYHRRRIGPVTDPIWTFLREEFYRRGVIFGRYNVHTREATVSYESPAIYGLAILTALEYRDLDFAIDLYDRLQTLQVRYPQSPYFGGYVFFDDTHSFDNLVPLLAERKARNEKILP